jgi:hypothetical protein
MVGLYVATYCLDATGFEFPSVLLGLILQRGDTPAQLSNNSMWAASDADACACSPTAGACPASTRAPSDNFSEKKLKYILR